MDAETWGAKSVPTPLDSKLLTKSSSSSSPPHPHNKKEKEKEEVFVGIKSTLVKYWSLE